MTETVVKFSNIMALPQDYKYPATASQSYRSTRSTDEGTRSFESAVFRGLAEDGGLFVPPVIPQLPSDFLDHSEELSFQDMAYGIMRQYITTEEIQSSDLSALIAKSYSTFRSKEITPVVSLDSDPNIYVLELFHGPTYAFKDVALQFLGNLFEFFLKIRNANKIEGEAHEQLTVVGATSGDTGGAAIYGLRGKNDVSVYILYPTGRVSPLQEAQMTTVPDKNIHTLSVKGTFDDCQSLVKQVFSDSTFNGRYHIGAVNSINWARILAQITYYFYSFIQLRKSAKSKTDFKVKYVVPSGNFGDILAGFFAQKMGLPIEKLIVATNENDILDRFLRSGKYDKKPVKATYSPAMDICVSSNFERFLWYMVRDTDAQGDDVKASAIVAKYMDDLNENGSFEVSPATLKACQALMESDHVTDEQTVATIRDVYQKTSNNYVLDPHSAVAVTVARRKKLQDPSAIYVSLSTAHPAKFSEVVNEALGDIPGYSFDNVLPAELKNLSTLQKRIINVETADLSTIEAVIEKEEAN